MREEYFGKWHQEHDPKPGEAIASQSLSYRGPSYDDLQPHLWTELLISAGNFGIRQILV